MDQIIAIIYDVDKGKPPNILDLEPTTCIKTTLSLRLNTAQQVFLKRIISVCLYKNVYISHRSKIAPNNNYTMKKRPKNISCFAPTVMNYVKMMPKWHFKQLQDLSSVK